VTAPELALRTATRADAGAVAELIYGAPGREAVAVLGGEAPARRFGFALAALQGRTVGFDRTLLALRGGTPVGALQWRLGSEPALPMSAGLVWAALRALGPLGALRAARAEGPRRRVNPKPPGDAFHIEELHVAPRLRGGGIGGRLLEHAEALARELGFPSLSLITHALNPAQRLYARAGFAVAERREDAEYERLTGIPGRILMVKPLRVVGSGGTEESRR
jgi:ribosomal protein S18 acetylase RimI-like enzyme